ncbi:MAG: hypothetical protein LUE26_07685 [Alistipes sp.]|nr:hypothetical protein [Alistipes sp.]
MSARKLAYEAERRGGNAEGVTWNLPLLSIQHVILNIVKDLPLVKYNKC